MSDQLNVGESIRDAVHLLGRRPLKSMGLLALIYAASALLPYILPDSVAGGSSIGMLVAFCYVYLIVIGYLLKDVEAFQGDEATLTQAAQGKFGWYLLFSLIFGFAAGTLIAIPLVFGMGDLLTNPEVLNAFETNPDAAIGLLLENGFSTLLIVSLVSILIVNVLTTAWFLVPIVMIVRGHNLASMGTSAAMVRPHFGKIYLISLVSIFINAALILFPQWLILTGQLADNPVNAALIGIPQGIGYAFSLALGVVVWKWLGHQTPAGAL